MSPKLGLADTTALDALGNPMRRQIVELLSAKPLAVGELADALPVSRPAVSKHLKLMQQAGLVVHESKGNSNVYRLDVDGFADARKWLDRFWGEALQRYRIVAMSTTRD